MRGFVVAVLLLLLPSVAAEGNSPASVSRPAASSLTPDLGAKADIDRREHDLALRNEISEARAAIESGAHNRLEILLAIFSVLVTLVVILLAINSRDAAVNAAKNAIESEKSKIADVAETSKKEAVQIRESTAQMLLDLKAKIEEVSILRTSLDEQAENMRDIIAREQNWMTVKRDEISLMSSEINRSRDQVEIDLRAIVQATLTGATVNSEEQQLLFDAIDEASGIDIRNLSESQLNAMTAKAALNSAWWDMEMFARELDKRFGDHHSARCASLFFRALAYSKRKHFNSAIKLYEILITEFSSFELPEFRSRVGRAMFNRARQFQLKQDFGVAAQEYDTVVQRCAQGIHEAEVDLWVSAQLNKGVCLAKTGGFENARSCYHAVIERFENAIGDLAAKSVTDAYYNLACSYGREGNPGMAIEMLAKWRHHSPNLGVDVINIDDAFDSIRRDPAFVAWILENQPRDSTAPLLL